MEQILEKIRLEGHITLKEIYLVHRDEFVQWARHQFQCDEEEALDVFQETVIALYENVMRGKLTELTSSLKTYLFAIGKNKLLELKRYKSRFDLSAIPDVPDEEPQVPDENMMAAVRGSIELLSSPCRKLLVDYYYHNRTLQEMMTLHGYKNTDTVKSQKYRCLQKLRKIFESLKVSGA